MTVGKSVGVSADNGCQARAERRILLNRRRRERELCRKKIILFAAAILLGGILAFTLNVIGSNAESKTAEPVYKYYQSYQIHPGDSLTSIAEEHIGCAQTDIRSYIREVMSINHLTDGAYLYAGNYIIIPYYSTEFVK